MSVFSFIELFGGLAFFLYGMTVLSDALKKTAGGRLEKLLKRATDNRFKGLTIGALITIAIQSSSAMTVMLVGFVNSGIMELGQTIGVIFGSDIGTTLTAWILSLSGIEGGDNIFLELLKPKNFSLIFSLIGVILLMASSKQKKKDIGCMLLGFGVLMQGMTMMSGSMAPLRDSETFTDLLTNFNNPLLGVLAGTLVTGVIQSSAASIGILQSLSLTGQLTYGMAIPIIMGANIGTCMTALLSSIGVNRDAKRVTAIHIAIKVIGCVMWLIIFYGLNAIIQFPFLDKTIGVVGIAAYHSIFNIVNTVVLIPFCNQLEKFAKIIVKDSKEENELFLDERLMATPTIAVAESANSVNRMLSKTRKGLDRSIEMLTLDYSEEGFNYITRNETRVDEYEDHIGSYLMKLTTTQHLSEEDKAKCSMMLQVIGEFERLSDHALNFAKSSEEKHTKQIEFSKYADVELERILAAVHLIYNLALDVYEHDKMEVIEDIGPLRIVISEMCDAYKASHVDRLSRGVCTAQQGFVFNDILYSCGRIADHSMNVAAIVYRFSSANSSKGSYMHDFKQKRDAKHEAKYKEYCDRFFLTDSSAK
ncbi:MAG: Na/Pi cotransporter family protein [Saccharofermentans sp.]|nr:Na/Pi cotransporter family protein [Saccharofermentans sp.]